MRAEVAQEALQFESAIDFFSNVIEQGCASGIINRLISYYDTHKFYDTHYTEIEDLRIELQEILGVVDQPQGDLKNWYARMAFEETAKTIANELDLEW
jgi:hypothetical protein